MFIVRLCSRPAIIAGDSTVLRELLGQKAGDPEVGYSLARASLAPGSRSEPHTLESTEVYYVLDGTGSIHVAGESCAVGPGDTVYVPPRALQWVKNSGTGEMTFLCIVNPPWRREDETIG